MPIGPFIEAAIQGVVEGVAYVAGDKAADKINRRYGMLGCTSSLLVIVAVIALFVYFH